MRERIAGILLGAATVVLLWLNPFGLPLPFDAAGRPAQADAAAATNDAAQVYMCPMHPEVIEAGPGTCPICKMALQPVESESAGDSGSDDDDEVEAVRIDPAQTQNIGVVSEAAFVDDIPDLVLVAGTTALFPYIQSPVFLARRAGKLTVEVNPEPTLLSDAVDFHLVAKAGEALPAMASVLATSRA